MFRRGMSPRPGKKLLVIDLNHTIADMSVDKYIHRVRPHLQEFMMAMFKNYDIIVWSGTTMHTILLRLYRLHLRPPRGFRFLAYLDKYEMETYQSENVGPMLVKPLAKIWKKFKVYNASNTFLLDDEIKNFMPNPTNGLLIKKYFYVKNMPEDNELMLVLRYAQEVLTFKVDFDTLDNMFWRHYVNQVKPEDEDMD